MAEMEPVRGELGQLFISERALEMIVYGALLEIDGLYAPDRVKGAGILDSISKAAQGDGIHIMKVPAKADLPEGVSPNEATELSSEEKVLKIKLSLVAEFGMPIHQVADQVINKVRAKVKELAGLEVEDVEVEITGIVKL